MPTVEGRDGKFLLLPNGPAGLTEASRRALRYTGRFANRRPGRRRVQRITIEQSGDNAAIRGRAASQPPRGLKFKIEWLEKEANVSAPSAGRVRPISSASGISRNPVTTCCWSWAPM